MWKMLSDCESKERSEEVQCAGLLEFITLDWTRGSQERARKGQSEPSGGLMGSPKQYGLHPGKEGLM